MRAGQVIGADYIVTGVIRSAAVSRSSATIEITGEVVTSVSSSAEVDYQVMEVATRQIKWANAVRTGDGSVGDMLDRLAGRIGQEITQTIYPMRLIKFDVADALVINQGGSALRVGQRLQAFTMGEALLDPYTNEPLGQAEAPVGMIEVTRVDAKLSYAKLISGALPEAAGVPPPQIVVRPPQASAAAAPASPRRAAPATPQQGTKLPFD